MEQNENVSKDVRRSKTRSKGPGRSREDLDQMGGL
jgi:hypothetical protein